MYFTYRVYSVLKEAQAVGMMTAYHNYLITNLVITVSVVEPEPEPEPEP